MMLLISLAKANPLFFTSISIFVGLLDCTSTNTGANFLD